MKILADADPTLINSPSACLNTGWTALQMAANCGAVVMVQTLLELGVKVDKEAVRMVEDFGNTPQPWVKGKVKVGKLLREKVAVTALTQKFAKVRCQT